MTNDSKHLAVYYKDYSVLRIFKIDTEVDPIYAFKSTFQNIQEGKNFVQYKSKTKSPMNSLWFEGSMNWILMMNDSELEVIDYGDDTKCTQVLKWGLYNQKD